MFRKTISTSFLMVMAVMPVLGGCSRDPKLRRTQMLESGQHYMQKSQYEAASIQFRRAVQLDPKFAEAHYELALSFAKLNRWQQAYRELQATIALDKNHARAHLAMADLLLAARQTAAARQEANSVLMLEPDNLNAHLLLGTAWLAEGNYKRALQEFTVSQNLAPESPVPFEEIGALHLRQGEYLQAIDALQHATKLDGRFVRAYLDLAQAYRAVGKVQQEIATLESAIEQNPKQTAPYVTLAQEYLTHGQGGQIEPLFARLRSATSDAPEVILRIGEFYFNTGDALRAQEIFTQCLHSDPKNNVFRRYLIEVLLSQQDWDAAEKLNEELLKSQPKDVDARLFEARLEFARGARLKGVSNLEHLVHDSPELPLPHFYLGLAYASQGQAGRAIAAFNDSVERNSSFIWAYVSLGELYDQQGSPKLALEFANKALRHNARFVPALLLQAKAYMQMGELDNAADKLIRLLAYQPSSAAVLERLAVVRIAQKQYRAAEEHLESALQTSPTYGPALLDLVRLYALQKQPGRILDRVQKQLRRAPNESNLYEILGGVHLDRQDYTQAEQAFSTALKLNPSATVALLQLSRLYATQGRTSEAIASSNRLVELHPDYLPGYVLLGSLYERSGDVSGAERTYRAVLQREEDYAPALNNLAWLYCESGGNLDMALNFAQKAKARLPDDPAVSDTLAWIEYRKGLYDSAISELEEATRQSSRNPTYQYHLGMALWKAGKTPRAKRALKQALDLQLPSNAARDARTVLAQLEGS